MAYLYLSDGTVYEGEVFGYEGDAIGEVVFNTNMTGYQELITDPSYYGQIVNMTYPLIGNYGVNKFDNESDFVHVKGLIVRDYTEVPSNWRSERTLDEYLKENKVVAIHGIDTRALTRKLRNDGVMNGIICREYPTKEQIEAVKAYKIENPVEAVSIKSAYDVKGTGKRVAVIDYGMVHNIVSSLTDCNFDLRIFPASVTAEEVLAFNPDGIMIADGPGNPAENAEQVETIKKLVGKKPIFAVGLGHQLLALAMGGKTYKMKYGHRGGNQPVKDLTTGRVYITAQNHGYCVDEKSITGKVTHVNWNDRTPEGIEYEDVKAFSVQFYVSTGKGTFTTNYLFEKFAKML